MFLVIDCEHLDDIFTGNKKFNGIKFILCVALQVCPSIVRTNDGTVVVF